MAASINTAPTISQMRLRRPCMRSLPLQISGERSHAATQVDGAAAQLPPAFPLVWTFL
jgi:hypothetical protein